MASKRAIDSILTKVAANYGKHQKWAGEVHATWAAGLQRFTDRDVLTASKQWLNNESKPPTVANIRNTIKGLNGEETDRPSGCSRCAGTGCVEIAHHTSGKRGQPSTVVTLIAGCDCPYGEHLCAGSYVPFQSVVDRMRANPYTIAVYHSEPNRPTLQPAERMAPADLERLAPSLADKTISGDWQRVQPG